MPIVSSPLATNFANTPIVRADQIGKMAGLVMIFPTVAALAAAVTAERSANLWGDGQIVGVLPEVKEGVWRTWKLVGQHARTVLLSPGVSAEVPADTNAVTFAAGAPAVGDGADGDLSVDWAGNAMYLKDVGAWALQSDAPAGAGGSGPIAHTGVVDFDEAAKDAVATALADGTHTGITVSYDPVTRAISLTGAAGGGVSTDAGNVLTLGADSLPYLPNEIDGGGASTVF